MSGSRDIVERLQDWQDYEPVKMFGGEILKEISEAAHEIGGLRAQLEYVVEECAQIAESHAKANGNPNYNEACQDIAEAIRAAFYQTEKTYQCSVCESDWGADLEAARKCCSKHK